MWGKQCSLGLMVRGEDKDSHPLREVACEQDFAGPFSPGTFSAPWVPLMCIKRLPECHTSLATSQVTPFQLQPLITAAWWALGCPNR